MWYIFYTYSACFITRYTNPKYQFIINLMIGMQIKIMMDYDMVIEKFKDKMESDKLNNDLQFNLFVKMCFP